MSLVSVVLDSEPTNSQPVAPVQAPAPPNCWVLAAPPPEPNVRKVESTVPLLVNELLPPIPKLRPLPLRVPLIVTLPVASILPEKFDDMASVALGSTSIGPLTVIGKEVTVPD